MANVTIYDVAGAAKVSLATVSRVMNNPEKVNPETRDRVLKVIKELGYRPNAIARGLASRKTTTVGVVCADISAASTSNLLSGISEVSKMYNYVIKLFGTGKKDDIKEVISEVVAEQVDGILFLNDELDNEKMSMVVNYIKDANLPLVLCNVIYDESDVPSVAIDYEKATYEITKDLIKKGKKDIYLATTVHRYSINYKKIEGYSRAMKEAGLEPLVFRTSGDVSINRPHFEEYFKTHNVDAFISVRDSIAISFMNTMFDLGKKIPDDIEVIGLQNTKYALLSRPNLTCVDAPAQDIGAASMRLLTKIMKNEEVDQTKVVLPYAIIKRGTN